MLLAMLAVAVLLLLPGGLMLLAPWSVRPFLSAGFWIASWWWLSRLGPGRAAFLQGALVAFALLGLTRLLKPIEPRLPSVAALLVSLAMAVLILGPLSARWPVPADAAFDALSARLLADRDGIPETYEPLLPIPRFGLRPQGLAGLTADVSLLSGAASPEALLAVAGAAQALLALAAFHVARRFASGVPAALGAAGLALLSVALGALASGTVLGIALALVAAPHVVSRHRAPTVAAGVLLGASVLCGGIAAPLAILGLASASALARARENRSRLFVALAVAGLVALPAFLRVGATRFLELPALANVRSDERRSGPDDRAAMAWLEAHTDPLAVVCAEDSPAAEWIPSVARRALVQGGRGFPVPVGIEAPVAPRPCTLRYGPAPGAGQVRFRSGDVTIVEISKSLR